MVAGTSFALVGDMRPPPYIETEKLVGFGAMVAIAMIVLGLYFARRMRRQK